MATQTRNSSQSQSKSQSQSNTNMNANQVLPDLIYDMVTILHAKGEGLQAYDKYIKDAQAVDSTECVELLQRLKEQDSSMVQEIQEHLSQLLQSGPMQGSSRSGARRSEGDSQSFGQSADERMQ